MSFYILLKLLAPFSSKTLGCLRICSYLVQMYCLGSDCHESSPVRRRRQENHESHPPSVYPLPLNQEIHSQLILQLSSKAQLSELPRLGLGCFVAFKGTEGKKNPSVHSDVRSFPELLAGMLHPALCLVCLAWLAGPQTCCVTASVSIPGLCQPHFSLNL